MFKSLDRKYNNNLGTILLIGITILLLSIPKFSCAVPAASIEETITQPDGTEFKAVQRGDEWQHWYETEDGYTIIRDQDTGWWYYAESDEHHVAKKSQHKVGIDSPEYLNFTKGIKPSRREQK